MRVGERVRVVELNRPTDEDREECVDREGLLSRRLNVPWNPEFGALWEVTFDNGQTVVFADSELAVVSADGEPVRVDMQELRESWGDAPRTISIPFRRLGGGTTGPAVLALLVFCLAGLLLAGVAITEGSIVFGVAGALLVLLGIAAAAVLVS